MKQVGLKTRPSLLRQHMREMGRVGEEFVALLHELCNVYIARELEYEVIWETENDEILYSVCLHVVVQ
ncbi:hypothetical protein AMTR_s00010p00257800 [Amborella trichopoda]|uniref:Uncharacterized protein n=1 Tax=Amborella trichopoda TaxID=13333 RepID=W1NGY5_AMBTC|nr:hypothetical protein AMTR_s00010p00257800 [Amborella trichopoda]